MRGKRIEPYLGNSIRRWRAASARCVPTRPTCGLVPIRQRNIADFDINAAFSRLMRDGLCRRARAGNGRIANVERDLTRVMKGGVWRHDAMVHCVPMTKRRLAQDRHRSNGCGKRSA